MAAHHIGAIGQGFRRLVRITGHTAVQLDTCRRQCRLAAFLLEERALGGDNTLKPTHETIANHLGATREVVTRMPWYFQSEGMVKLAGGMWRSRVRKSCGK